MKHLYTKITLSVAVIVMTLAGFLGQNTSVSATKTSVNASVTIPEACTMYGSGMDSHTATINPNTYRQDIGKTTFTVKCNDANGFAIYAIGFTGDAYDGDNTKLIGQSTNTSISTKTYASGDSTSNWSMKVSKVTDSAVSYNPANMSIQNSFDNWHVIPASYTKVAQYHANTGSSTTDTELGAKIETTYATYIASNQPADVYEGKVKYTLVHPYDSTPLQPYSTEAGCIRYYPNGNNVVGTMGCQSITNTATGTTLLASNYSRTGYGFAGWSDVFDYDTNPNAKFYGPQEYITFTAGQYTGTNPGLSLYAVWVKSQGSIQDGLKVYNTCNSLTTAPTDGTANLSSVSAFTDERDNNTYAIAKLADGNCWMIENLRLENTNSDNSTGALAQGYGTSATYGNFAGLANPETADKFDNVYSANSLYSNDGTNNTINIGTNAADYRMPHYNNINTPTNSADRPQYPTANNSTNNISKAGLYSYGNYYSWNAAIADTTYYTSGDHNNTSICPTGWRLPLGRISTGDINLGSTDADNRVTSFSYLDRKLGGTGTTQQSTTEAPRRWTRYPNNFIYSGYIIEGSWTPPGSFAYYWSSTNNILNGYVLSMHRDAIYPGNTYDENYNGMSVRCIADDDFTPPPL